MLIEMWFRRALVVVALGGVAVAASACSSAAEEPVGSTSSSLTVAPLGARERRALAARAGDDALHLDKGGKITKEGVVYAAAPSASGKWSFAVLDSNGTIRAFRLVDPQPGAAAGTATDIRPANLRALAEEGGSGGGSGGGCNRSSCDAATSAAAAAFADFVAAADDEWTALVYGLTWYSREVAKEDACRSCG